MAVYVNINTVSHVCVPYVPSASHVHSVPFNFNSYYSILMLLTEME